MRTQALADRIRLTRTTKLTGKTLVFSILTCETGGLWLCDSPSRCLMLLMSYDGDQTPLNVRCERCEWLFKKKSLHSNFINEFNYISSLLLFPFGCPFRVDCFEFETHTIVNAYAYNFEAEPSKEN